MARKLLLSGLFFGLVLVGVDRFSQPAAGRAEVRMEGGTPIPYPFPAR